MNPRCNTLVPSGLQFRMQSPLIFLPEHGAPSAGEGERTSAAEAARAPRAGKGRSPGDFLIPSRLDGVDFTNPLVPRNLHTFDVAHHLSPKRQSEALGGLVGASASDTAPSHAPESPEFVPKIRNARVGPASAPRVSPPPRWPKGLLLAPGNGQCREAAQGIQNRAVEGWAPFSGRLAFNSGYTVGLRLILQQVEEGFQGGIRKRDLVGCREPMQGDHLSSVA
jgi:hypothetical protein